ncbi:hypothetical protein DZA65_00456 [Dickeya dianthicola]|nr:hypothetical protein DZA65_00456 [Dickeya dianthicola]
MSNNWHPSRHDQPAIHIDRLTGDVARVVGGEKSACGIRSK